MAPGGRLPGWHPAREFHHGPELKRSIREAEDTDAVDLSLNSKIKYQDAEKNLREKDMGQLRLLDRRSPDTGSWINWLPRSRAFWLTAPMMERLHEIC